MFNEKIGKKYKSCVYAVSDLSNIYDDILLTLINTDSEHFSIKKGLDFVENNLVEIDKIEDYALVSFQKNKITKHIGIMMNGYCYHQEDDSGLVAQELDTIIETSVYNNYKLYKIKEV